MKRFLVDYEKLKNCWYLGTSGISRSKTIPNYKPINMLESWNFSNSLHRARNEPEEHFEEWVKNRDKTEFKNLTLNLLFHEPFQPWTLVFETLEECKFYDLIHKHLMVQKEENWSYDSSAAYNFSKVAYATDFTFKQSMVDDAYTWCYANRPDLLIDSRISSVLTIKSLNMDTVYDRLITL